jgi:DNA end-binding protein Ku
MTAVLALGTEAAHFARFAMNMRYSWKGFVKLSLATIPVKAYPVAVSGSEVHLHQLHATCKSRVKYKKTCPLHGELAQSDIVSGYEYAKDRYVVVDPDELDKLRTESDKAIQIDAFIPAGTLDPIYANGKSYYLAPDGPVAHKGYTVLWRGMVEEQRQAIAEVVMHGKEHVVWLRPLGGIIVLSQLCYANQVTKPDALAVDMAPAEASREEMRLLRTLMAKRTPKKFDLAKYQDRYTAKLTQLIEAKVADTEIVAATASPLLHVINLVDALRQSLAEAGTATDDASSSGQTPTAKSKPSSSRKKKPMASA